MVLNKKEILERMRKPASNRQSLVITPLLCRKESDVFDADSVDLRLGCYFLLPKTLDQPFFSPDKTSATSLHVRVHVPLGEFLVVPAHQTILGATLEFIKLPSDVSGEVLTKSSVARTFIVVETAPWIHPQYRGCLTLEIARFICQLILMHTADNPEEKPDPSYFGPVYPEAPKFRDPQDDLLKIGVTKVSRLKKTRVNWKRGKWAESKNQVEEW